MKRKPVKRTRSKRAFKVGDYVTWKSQAAGSETTKRGRVVEVVPSWCRRPKTMGRGMRNGRDHESYVVEVVTRSTRGVEKKKTNYWPVVKQLKPDGWAMRAARKRVESSGDPDALGGIAVDVRKYLGALPEWDRTPRLEMWLIRHAGAADTNQVRQYSREALVSAVQRVLTPGCKVDGVLVLQGDQGVGKTALIQALCPDSAWFGECLPAGRILDVQDASERERYQRRPPGGSKWIIELDDLVGANTHQRNRIRSLVSDTHDTERLMYDRHVSRVPRQFIVIGTSNRAYLGDRAESRRYWPVLVQDCYPEGIRAERDQLWAEALLLARSRAVG